MKKALHFVRSEAVLTVAGIAAFLSACLVPPSPAYIEYLDFKVLSLLFCLMAVVAGITKTGAFAVLSQALTERAKGVKLLSAVLILLCFFSAMFITNDVSLITFVPLAVSVLSFAAPRQLIFVVTMQTIAANLGSMLTPVGNPQNLFLYSKFHMDLTSFLHITFPVCTAGLLMILITTFFIKSGNMEVRFPQKAKIANKTVLACYIALFMLCLATVSGFVHYAVTLGIVCAAVLVLDKSIFKKIDYPLLLTFVFFFVFVGNVAKMESVRSFISQFLHGKELLCSILLSQFISNVPAAVMLSSFTQNSTALVAGTNIGGLGTLVASLASLISFKLYAKSPHADTKAYITFFTKANLLLLIPLTLLALLFYR